jgi:hypothetical protein
MTPICSALNPNGSSEIKYLLSLQEPRSFMKKTKFANIRPMLNNNNKREIKVVLNPDRGLESGLSLKVQYPGWATSMIPIQAA